MKKHWQFIPLAALSIAAICIAFDWHIAETGYMHWIVKLFGQDFGITQVKAHNRFYWFGEPHTIPLYAILFNTALVAIFIAIISTWRHFRLQNPRLLMVSSQNMTRFQKVLVWIFSFVLGALVLAFVMPSPDGWKTQSPGAYALFILTIGFKAIIEIYLSRRRRKRDAAQINR